MLSGLLVSWTEKNMDKAIVLQVLGSSRGACHPPWSLMLAQDWLRCQVSRTSIEKTLTRFQESKSLMDLCYPIARRHTGGRYLNST
jgi:hypothetical protein